MPMHFLFRPLPHVSGTPPWLLRPMRVSISSELYPNTWLFFVFLFFLNAQASSFLIYTHVTDLRDTMPCQRLLTHTFDLLDTMPRQRSLYTYLGKQRISLGVIDILSRHLCLHTQFAYHQKVYTGRFYLRLSSAMICEESALREV